MTHQPETRSRSTAQDRAERMDARLKIATAVLTLLTAVLALLTALFVRKSGEASAQADTARSQVETLASQNAALTADNAVKDQRIGQLEASAPASAAVDDVSDAPSAGSSAPETFHHGPLTLRVDASADLDAQPDQTQWGVNGTDWDLLFESSSKGSHLKIWTFSYALLSQQDASFLTCKSTTGYSSATISVLELKKAKTLCVITNGHRYSALKIVSADDGQVSFDVTTYAG